MFQHIMEIKWSNINGRKICLVLFLLVVGFNYCSAQEVQKNSYIPKKSKSSYPSKIEDNIGPLISKAETLMSKDPAAAIETIENALTESIKTGDRYYEAQCYRVLGAINLKSNLNELAVKNSLKSFQILAEMKNESSLSEVRVQLADCYERVGNTEEAVRLYSEQLALYRKNRNEKEALKMQYKIAGLYVKQAKLKQAQSIYQEILAIEQKKGNKEGIVEANNKIGETFEKQSNNKQALEYYNRAQNIAENSNDVKSINSVNENISSVLKKEKKYEEEIVVRKRGLELSKEKNDPISEGLDNLAIAKSYLDTKRPEEAIPYLKRSIELMGKNGDLSQKAEVYRQLSNAYSQEKSLEKALLNFKKYSVLKDSVLAMRERELERAISSNLSLTEKQKQIDLLEKDIELNEQKIETLTSEQSAKEERLSRQRVVIYSLIFGIILIVSASYLVYKNAQKRRIANQLLALKSLRSQMNPHFIFNALNSVNSFISKNDEKSANKYLSDFSRLMRMVMENSQLDFVPLAGEINILELYLGLEHFRFREKFDYTFTVDHTIDKDAFEIPPMLIQPYIENAVWHGLRYKEEKGILNVSFHLLENNQIKVIIEDDGVGRKKSAQLKTVNQKTGSSTGIKNTVNRIAIINDIYKKNIIINIEDIYPGKEDTGTRVTIVLPGKITKLIL
jgi:two-component system LytT family sensor kinase